jgi:dephospho-CoA kinase
MLKIGLTGGIGSGKSVVAEIFRVLGIPVFDADREAKNIMNADAALMAAIISEFGEQAYVNDQLDRKYIADIVFKDPFKLEKLNALVHPAAITAAEKWWQVQTTPYVIKEAALLFEAGSASHLDYVIGVRAPKALRIHRVMQRENTTREEVLLRMQRQIDDDIKMRLCDFVIDNDEQQMLLPQVLQLHEKFINEALTVSHLAPHHS